MAQLYHASFLSRADSIEADGLIPGAESTWVQSNPEYVYLSETSDMASEWVDGAYDDGLAPDGEEGAVIYAIDMECLDSEKLEPDPDVDGAPNYRYVDPIPAECLRRISTYYYYDDMR